MERTIHCVTLKESMFYKTENDKRLGYRRQVAKMYGQKRISPKLWTKLVNEPEEKSKDLIDNIIRMDENLSVIRTYSVSLFDSIEFLCDTFDVETVHSFATLESMAIRVNANRFSDFKKILETVPHVNHYSEEEINEIETMKSEEFLIVVSNPEIRKRYVLNSEEEKTYWGTFVVGFEFVSMDLYDYFLKEIVHSCMIERTAPTGKESSIHYSKQRFEVAQEIANLPVNQNTSELSYIIKAVNVYLHYMGLETGCELVVMNPLQVDDLYKKIQDEYNLNNPHDIVWMKFTKDGYLGVVASGSDINFKKPNSKSEYNLKYDDKWAYNTSGILIDMLGKEWDESFVLVFPLVNIPKHLNRQDIENGIGNFLLYNSVRILDLYSHRYKTL